MNNALGRPNTPAEVAISHIPQVGYVRLPRVCAVTGLARSTIWAWVRQKRFPAPTKLSARMSAWRVEDLHAWLADPVAWQAKQQARMEG
ncbi:MULTISPECIES: AlpA family transcriptional regulator [unclassified Herbaspirillum]|uniref:helix-turn-helix transcriptional regulator n=1 Tax=unclassified Herbaspirillum TaxID=2624150 RepID=UPI00115024BB|nr:AlpA family transcriptional regulator [Herbaspirillum sp. SJZ130]TQK09889.1 AlpA family transcriptional regulator [Herbaspirillum sp. SJZ106]